MSANNHQKPVFDFSAHSWKDSKRVEILQAKANQVAQLLKDRQTQLNVEAFEATLAKLAEVTHEFEAAISRVLVSVPSEWLVKGAPDDLDWHDPESLNWLMAPKMRALQQAMVEAQRPEEVSGN